MHLLVVAVSCEVTRGECVCVGGKARGGGITGGEINVLRETDRQTDRETEL